MPTLTGLSAVALGGAVGATARYLVVMLAAQAFGTAFPFGTMVVNLLGSFVMGFLVEAMVLGWAVTTEVRLLLTVGFLGAFTTFSTFSLDFATLFERGKWLLSAVYVAGSVVSSIGALLAGLLLARRWLQHVP